MELDRKPSSSSDKIPNSLPIDQFRIRLDTVDQKLKAKQFLEESGSFKLALDVARKVEGTILAESEKLGAERIAKLLAKDSYALIIMWNQKKIDEGEYLGDAVLIEGLPNGSIIVHGSPYGGSTVLLEKEWKRNRGLQLIALTKAVFNPTSLITASKELNLDQRFIS